MADEKRDRKKGPIASFFTNVNNNGIPSMNEQNLYNPNIRDWEHRKNKIKGNW